MVALLWPAAPGSALDGAPLNGAIEAILIGVVVPVLIWLHPAFLRRRAARAAIIAIFLTKIIAALLLQQQGWCVAFEPPYPMVRDSTGKPHAWDIRADWLADDPRCSAIMTRGYHDAFELPAWFYNLPPPDEAVVRDGFHPGEIPVRVVAAGFIDVRRPGRLSITTAEAMQVNAAVNGVSMQRVTAGTQELLLPAGLHSVRFEGVLLGKEWPIVPEWDGVEMGAPGFPLVTIDQPARIDRFLGAYAGWALAAASALLILAWAISTVMAMTDRHVLFWSAAAAIAVATMALAVPDQAASYTALVMAASLLIPIRQRFQNARGVFYLLIVPWLAFMCAVTANEIGRWTLYGIGNDDFQFQRFSYRIFMQHFWLEGGQVTFWNQPLYRWIAGVLHMIFGDSSVGQVYWDAAGVAAFAVFAYRIVAPLTGFTWGLLSALVTLAMFLLGPGLEFVGFGLSEISSAAFVYLAVFFVLRNRGAADLIAAGVLLVLGVYTRLNNLPMAAAVAAFALPLSTPAKMWIAPRVWWARVRWRTVLAIGIALGIGGLLFAWRTWHYTGVFSVFHGTQRELLAVWKPGMGWTEAVPAMGSSLLMVLTGQDPPAFAWYAAPILAAAAIAIAAVLWVPVLRDAPLPLVLFFAAGASSALVTRGWAYEGRFSIHLYGAASALCGWALAAIAARLQSGLNKEGS